MPVTALPPGAFWHDRRITPDIKAIQMGSAADLEAFERVS
jgi:hypothetical protein